MAKIISFTCCLLVAFYSFAGKALAQPCPTDPCTRYRVKIRFFSSYTGTWVVDENGYDGSIGNLFTKRIGTRNYLYLQTSIGCPYFSKEKSVGWGHSGTILEIFLPKDDGFIWRCDPSNPPKPTKKYFLWVDTFRGNKGILWGMFNGAPDGCTVVGAYIDGTNITRYKGNLKDSEVDFGYELIKSKEGYDSPPIDFNKLPINYRDSNYEEYYFRANWVSPNCYWQVREVRRNSFGGIFDFLWNLFK